MASTSCTAHRLTIFGDRKERVTLLTTNTRIMATHPLYQHDAALHTTTVTVVGCESLTTANTLSEGERGLFKSPSEQDYIVTTAATIFHAQGGGQPTDTGTMTMRATGPDGQESVFEVASVRHGDAGRILHCGKFTAAGAPFTAGIEATQTIDSAKRTLHSRIHTAGHLIGLAVRHLANEVVQGGAHAFSEQKASHYPGDARVEFGGLIAGEHTAAIQRLANEYVKRALPVNICFCKEMDEVRRRCGEDATKDMKMTDEMRQDGGMRVVEVEQLGGYPCGGTHLPLTSDVGGIVVTGIKRRQGVSKVSYGIVDSLAAAEQ